MVNAYSVMFKKFTEQLIADYGRARVTLYKQRNKPAEDNRVRFAAERTVAECENLFKTRIWEICTTYYTPAQLIKKEWLVSYGDDMVKKYIAKKKNGGKK